MKIGHLNDVVHKYSSSVSRSLKNLAPYNKSSIRIQQVTNMNIINDTYCNLSGLTSSKHCHILFRYTSGGTTHPPNHPSGVAKKNPQTHTSHDHHPQTRLSAPSSEMVRARITETGKTHKRNFDPNLFVESPSPFNAQRRQTASQTPSHPQVSLASDSRWLTSPFGTAGPASKWNRCPSNLIYVCVGG